MMKTKFSKLTATLIAVFLVSIMLFFTLPLLNVSAAVTGGKFENSQLDIVSEKTSTLAPGVTENKYTVYDKNGDQVKMFVATADMSVDSVKVFTSYKDMDPTTYGMSKLTAQVEAFNKKAAAGDPYYQGTVVAGINASYYNMINGQPTGIFVMNGIVGNASESAGYFAVLKDGTVKIGVQGDYAKDAGNIQEALGIYDMLIKDGKICLSDSQMKDTAKYPRQTIGITADNKVIVMSADGNQAPSSIGLTYAEQAQVMLDLGCTWAGHLDGGGSMTYGSKAEGSDEFTIANNPSDGSPRDISNGFIIVSTAVASYTFDHVAYEVADQYVTPGTTTEIGVTGVSSTGHAADMPEGLTYEVVNGTYEGGVFTAGSELGTATVTAMYNGKAVGSATVNVVAPDKITFGSSDMTVPFGKSVDLRITATLGVHNVKINENDLTYTLTNAAIGAVNGFIFTAAEALSGEAKSSITATLKLDASVCATANITLGKGSEVLYNFEDGDVSDFALGYTPYNYVLPNSKVYAVTSETGKVHSGNSAMALNIDYSNSLESGYMMTALQFNAETVNFENATKLGMWMYIPDETVASWIRFTVTPISAIGADGAVTVGSVINNTICDDSLSSGTGFVNTFEESGWHYLSIDLSEYKGVQLQKGQYIMQFYISDRDGASNNYYVSEHSSIPGNFTFYVDDITVDYSSAVDDRDAPVFQNPTYATSTMADAVAIAKNATPTVNNNTVSFATKVADFTSSNATGLNASTAKAYVDGNEVSVALKNDILSVENVVFADGVHTIKFTICDNQGNFASVVRKINVQANSGLSTIKVVPHDASLDRILLGSIYYVDIVATDIEKVQSVTAVIDLNSISVWQLDHMLVAKGFKATYSIQADENIATITITRTGEVQATGENYLVSMPIRTWELKMGYTYESGTKKGQTAYTYKQFRDMGEIWRMDIFMDVDKGLVTFIDGTTSTFSGERVQVDTEMWINKKANMVATDEGSAYYNAWNGGHIHIAEAIANKAATCTEDGYENRTFCSVCSSVVEWGVTIPATGHTYAVVDGVLKCACGELYNGEWTDGKTYVEGLLIADGWTEDFAYYVDGVKLTGLQLINGLYYDFGTEGVCLNKARLDGFYFNAEVNKYMYFASGTITIGESITSPEVYFFDENGYAISGDIEIWGYLCTFDEKGAFVSSTDASVVDAGFSGTNLNYVLLANGTLMVGGEGVMKDYESKALFPAWVTKNEMSDITSVYIGNGITEIGRFGFYRNGYVKEVKFEENSNLKTIGWGAFGHNWRLEKVTIPASVEVLGEYAFYECGALSQFNFEANSKLNTIKAYAFQNDRALKTLTIPATVNNMGAEVFIKTSPDLVLKIAQDSAVEGYALKYNLKYELYVSDVRPTPLYSGAYSQTINWELYPSNTLYLTGTGAMPDLANYTQSPINKYAYDIKKVVIGKDITSVGNYSFAYAFKNLEYVEFESGSALNKVGILAFMNCAKLKTIVLPETVTYIGVYAFGDCFALESAQLPQAVTYIGATAFTGSSKVVANVVEGTYAETFVKANGIDYTTREYVPVVVQEGTFDNLTWTLYDNGMLAIGGSGAMTNRSNYNEYPWYSFSNKVTKLVVGKDVTTIGNYAFAYAYKNMTAVEFEEGSKLTSVGFVAFMNCAKLKTIVLPETVTYIGVYAFGDCFALESAQLPQAVTYIGATAFTGSSKVVANVVEGTYAETFVKANGIDYTTREYRVLPIANGTCGENATWTLYNDGELKIEGSGEMVSYQDYKLYPWFNVASQVKKITIGKDITRIGNYAFAYYFQNLETVVFEEGSKLTTIGAVAFMNCAKLKTIVLPETVTYVGVYAFADCFALESVYLPLNVTFIGNTAFANCSKLILSVAEGSYAKEVATANDIKYIVR